MSSRCFELKEPKPQRRFQRRNPTPNRGVRGPEDSGRFPVAAGPGRDHKCVHVLPVQCRGIDGLQTIHSGSDL